MWSLTFKPGQFYPATRLTIKPCPGWRLYPVGAVFIKIFVFLSYTFLTAVFNTERRKRTRNMMITGAKTSNQPMRPKIILMIKRMQLKSTPNRIKISLKPRCFVFLVLLFAINSLNSLTHNLSLMNLYEFSDL